MGKIVYHATFSEYAPHEWGEPFHTGTEAATEDRVVDIIQAGEEEGPAIVQRHAYEISDTAPISRMTWADPDDHPDTGPNVVPEFNTKRIYPYKNSREDKGSTSYVIPSDFVGNHVKHLGVQFQGFVGTDEQHDALMSGISTMVGGKSVKG
jgi:hypothetical protein